MVSYIHKRGDEQVDGWPRTLSENMVKGEDVAVHNNEIEGRELEEWKT